MEQAPVCMKCRTWEEDFYWKHFSSMHFFVFLPSDFRQHLVLPAKFAHNMIRKLPDKMSLIGPSSTVWDIELKKTDRVEFVGDGWIQFVKAHNLEENNVLVFKYKMNLSFEVLIFDFQSYCEKETSYFVKQCMHEREVAECGNEKKRTITEAFSMEVIENGDNGDTLHNDSDLRNCVAEEPRRKSPRITRKSIACAQARTRPKRMLRSCESKSKLKTLSEKEAEVNRTEDVVTDKELPENEDLHELIEKKLQKNGATRKLSRSLERDQNALENGAKEQEENGLDIVEEETEENGTAKRQVDVSEIEHNSQEDRRNVQEIAYFLKSAKKKGKFNRRSVTNIQKEMALKLALQKMNENSFVVVMRPSAIYRRCYLNVPSAWMDRHLCHRTRPVVLRMGGKTWDAFFYYNRNKGGGLSGKGWKEFALHNYLEEFDVCLFTKAADKDDQFTMDVEIFRVTPQVVRRSRDSGSKYD